MILLVGMGMAFAAGLGTAFWVVSRECKKFDELIDIAMRDAFANGL